MAALPAIALSHLALREGNAKKPVYMMHKWWARRLGVVFRMLLIRHAAGEDVEEKALWDRFYSGHSLPAGFVVLDPFLGGGTTLVEAAKQGASCIGVDIDPVACFITELELAPPDPAAVRARYDEIEKQVSRDLLRFYRSTVDGQQVEVIYYFWVDRVTCPDCGLIADAHPTFQVAYDQAKNTQVVVCPACQSLSTLPLDRDFLYCHCCKARTRLSQVPVSYGKYSCPGCAVGHPMRDLWKDGAVRPYLFAHEYVDPSDGIRKFASASPADRALYTKASLLYGRTRDFLPIPQDRIPTKGRSDKRPLLYGYRYYHELFNDRQLLCLGTLASAIRETRDLKVRRALTLAFSHSLATNNMFCFYAFGYRRRLP